MIARMKIFVALSMFLCTLAAAEDLTGRWVATETTPNGQKRETTVALIAEGNSLKGFIANPRSTMLIVEGRVDGNNVSFTVLRESNGVDKRADCTAELSGDGLKVTIPSDGTRPATVLAAKRLSTDRPTMPAPKISLSNDFPPVKYNGLAKTPPMGWNSWNKFHRSVDDKAVRGMADAMASNGMKDAGYVYVNIDDTWEGTRDASGVLQSNEKFPDMKALADYVHSKGLKIGIYSSPGPKTCAGFEGSFGHEEQDAKMWAQWGFDYLKYDWCSASQVYDVKSLPAVYAKMGEALLKAGRPIVYSLCQYGWQDVGEWGAKVGGNLWRTTGDISDRWPSMMHIGFELQAGRQIYANAGHWNDPDMLEIGNGAMTDEEYRTHMSLWCLLAAPLLAGNDLRDMKKEISDILTNREVIAIDQDSKGVQGVRVSKNGDLEVWEKPLADGSLAVGLFNLGTDAATVRASFSDLKLSGTHEVRDLWAHADKGKMKDHFEASVPSHGVVLVKIAK
jgi:alpha-galactosidase